MTRKKRPSAVELSPNRREIEEMILEGKSDRTISEWLLSQNEKIGYGAIFNYRKNKFNIKDEAVKNYNEKKSKERKTKAVKKVVSDLDALDDIIAEGQKVKLNIDSICEDFENGVSYVHIEKLKIDAKRLTIQAVKAKHDITKDEPTPVFIVKVEDADAEEQRLIEETADNLARQTEDTESSES
jgi:hypothetical protein